MAVTPKPKNTFKHFTYEEDSLEMAYVLFQTPAHVKRN